MAQEQRGPDNRGSTVCINTRAALRGGGYFSPPPGIWPILNDNKEGHRHCHIHVEGSRFSFEHLFYNILHAAAHLTLHVHVI